jgi:hypothetical protein
MSVLRTPTEGELMFSSLLRNKVTAVISQNNLSEKQVADKLDLLPTGVEALFSIDRWPINTAIRVAFAFGIIFTTEIFEVKSAK